MTIQGDTQAIAKVLGEGLKVSSNNREAKYHLQGAFRRTLTGVRSGRIYTTFFFTDPQGNVRPIGNRPPHQASAPGEPPARDTGSLLRSMRYKSKRLPDGAELEITVGANYGSYLEFGTSKMLARPFVRPTTKREMPKVRKIYADGIESRERRKARQLGGLG